MGRVDGRSLSQREVALVKKVQFRAPPKVCTYCDDRPAISVDHVPPKNLFTRPLPPRVVVPACEYCNTTRFGALLDEQFRDLLSLRIGKRTPESAAFYDAQVKPSLIRGSDTARLKVTDFPSWTETTSTGMFFRPEPIRGICLLPLEVMAERLARSYYRKRFGERLPLDVPIRDGGFGKTAPFSVAQKRFDSFLEFEECQVVRGSSGNAFKYVGFRHIKAKNDSIWLFDFYDLVVFSAFTGVFATLPHSSSEAFVDEIGRVRTVKLAVNDG